MTKREITSISEQRPLLLVRLHQEAELRRRYIAYLPWWRHPLIGYISTVPLTALGLLVPFAERMWIGQNNFLGAPLFLVTVIVALFWGTGPALCAIALGLLSLDYFFLPPYDQFVIDSWQNVAPLIPYLIAEIVIALITAQRERARQRALFAEQEIQARAEELEQINEELKQANQLKDIFFSRASHELKTPLTTIQGQAQIGLRRLTKIADPPPGLDIVRGSLEKVNEQAHRLHALIDDLLDLGMLSAGKMKLRMKRCDIGEICREVVHDQGFLSGRKIELSLPEQPLILRADSARLNQVILNLVTNAIKYSDEGTTIQLRAFIQASTAIIQVHNTGPAIRPEQHTSIFEPFYRTPDDHTTRKQGWGLGLAITKDIVERHNGCIKVESTTETGTTFSVQLPLA